MSYILDKTNKFVQAMIDSEYLFASVENKVEDNRKTISNILENFEKETYDIINDCEKKENIKEFIEYYRELALKIESFIHEAKIHQQEQAEGYEFIHQFEKTFIVTIFGKVKSGKSYLGNYILGKPFKTHQISSKYDELGEILINVYDRGQSKIQDNLSEFGEDTLEATNSIQYYKIGGLTWFDTPGIGSITKENEELAEKYVKNSDLVIFASNSDAAGTQQEFEEMKDLVRMNKPILLLVTQSDTYDEDFDDDGNLIQNLVPKNQKDREDIENYLKESIFEKGLNDVLKLNSVLTISAKLAKEAVITENDAMFRSSNLDKFLDCLIEITTNKAAQMKLHTPYDRFNKLIMELIGNENEAEETSLYYLLNVFDQGLKNVRELIEKSQEDKKLVYEEIRYTCNEKINLILNKFKSELSADHEVEGSRIQEEIQEMVLTEIRDICNTTFNKFAKNSLNLLNVGRIKINVPDMKIKLDTIDYEKPVVNMNERAPENIIELFFSLFDKTYYRPELSYEPSQKTFAVGDNMTEIEKTIYLQMNDLYKNVVNSYLDEIVNGYYRPIQMLYEKLIQSVANLIERIKELHI